MKFWQAMVASALLIAIVAAGMMAGSWAYYNISKGGTLVGVAIGLFLGLSWGTWIQTQD